jgi:hypothetical protein
LIRYEQKYTLGGSGATRRYSGGWKTFASLESTALIPLHNPKPSATIARPGPAVAPCAMAAAPADAVPAATAATARPADTGAPRPSLTATLDPASAAAASQMYRRSWPRVLIARMSAKITGTAPATAAAILNNGRDVLDIWRDHRHGKRCGEHE